MTVSLNSTLDSSSPSRPAKATDWRFWVGCALETALLIAAMYWMHGTPAPEVNEPHYLSKAKHFWDPSWCERDVFLNSPDVHYFFEYSFGWLTLYFSFPTVAWIGRGIAWVTLAASWCFLSRTLVPRFGASLASGLLLLLGVKHFHLAGEWLVGGVEAKCFSFPFVFLGVGLFLRGAWRASCVALGAATAMHVLTGGWAFLAVLASAILTKSQPRFAMLLQGLAVAALIGALGIVPALLGTRSGPKQEASAYMIYVYERLPHHLVLRDMAIERKEQFGILTAAWLLLAPVGLLAAGRDPNAERRDLLRGSRFQFIVAVTLGFALIGAALDQYSRVRPAEAAPWLRFYWFRASDIFVPAGFAIAAVFLADYVALKSRLARGAVWIVLIITAFFVFKDGQAQRRLRVPRADAAVIPHDQTPENSRSATHANWVLVCDWIEQNTPRDAIVWSARRQQSFKWYAQRAEVHNFKDVPQDPGGLLEWRARLEVVRNIARRGGLWKLSREELLGLQRQYGFTYVILYKSGREQPLPFDKVYPLEGAVNRHYEVYRLPPVAESSP